MKSRAQAIAIGLSEAREKGAKVPAPPRGPSRKKAARKTASRKGATRKSGARKKR